MADQSNISPNPKQLITGLNTDATTSQLSQGQMTWALNAVNESFDGNQYIISNEQGNVPCVSYPTGYRPIGHRNILEEGFIITWLVDENGNSEIGKITNCEYTTIINGTCLNLSIDFPILKHAHRNTNCGLEIYWVDARNRPRFIQMEKLPFAEIQEDGTCNVITLDTIDCNKLNLQPNFTIPQVDVRSSKGGGDLKAGAYQFAVQYANALGEPYTPYYGLRDAAPVFLGTQPTQNFDFPVDKALDVFIENIDTSGIFDYINLAVIKTINNISSVDLVGTYNITSTHKQVTYTGEGKDGIKLDIQDIYQRYDLFDIADDLTTAQDTLILSGITSQERITYQSIANDIKVKWATYRLRNSEPYADVYNASHYKGYMRDEVYALEIQFILKNGHRTDGFHIPGRRSIPSDLVMINNDDVPFNTDDLECAVVEPRPRWQVYNTSSITDKVNNPCIPPPSIKQLGGNITATCSDDGCTHQGSTTLKFVFSEPTTQAFTMLLGAIIHQPLIPDDRIVGWNFFTRPVGPLDWTYYDHPEVPFELQIPSGVTNITFPAPIYRTNNTIRPFICHPCIFPLTDVYVKAVSDGNLIQLNLTSTEFTVHNVNGTPTIPTPPNTEPCTDIDECYEGIWESGDMAYWQSTEVYSCNPEFGVLENTPIRHHKMPDCLVTHIHDEDFIYPLGIQIDKQQIVDLIKHSSLTEAQKSEIAGFSIVRANRANRASIKAKGLITNVLKASTENNIIDSATGLPSTGASGSADQSIKSLLESAYKFTAQGRKEYKILFAVTSPATGIIPGFGKEALEQDGRYSDALRFIAAAKDDTPIASQENLDRLDSAVIILERIQDHSATDVRGKAHSQAAEEIVKGAIELIKAQMELLALLASTDVSAVIASDANKYMFFPNYMFNDVRLDDSGKPRDFFIDNTIIDEDAKVRWTLHSPDTSFGKPELGNILKLETAEFGTSSGHIVEVKKHARYQFISKIGYITALLAGLTIGFASGSYGIGSVNVFNGQAMFTAYQAFLDILYKTVPKKNFGYQFNAVGQYTDFKPVLNDGNKQRSLDLSIYLSPGMLNVRDKYTVNNYQRESSVYLRSLKPLPYPHEIGGVPHDSSKLAVPSYDVINTPISAFYASIKNYIPNQYGQLYSYPVVDTGYYTNIDLNITNYHLETVFGGDTFINRFAYKSKIPFFIDNRVSFPDGADISYNELSNVGRVKYWFSTDVTANTSFFDSFFATMTQHFFWPRISELYLSGVVFLFAYGIPYFYCESAVNVDLRQAYNNKEGDFYPRTSSGIPDDWLQEINTSIQQDNSYWYNKSFSLQTKRDDVPHIPDDYDFNKCRTVYPYRAVFSEQNTDSPNPSDRNNWRIFKPASHFDFPQNYGKLTSLDGIETRQVLARFENKTLLYNALLTAPTSVTQLYLGQSLFQKSVPPIDYAETDLGYIGCQNKVFLKTEYGDISIDAKRGQIFLLQGQKATDLSAQGNGKFFTEFLNFQIKAAFPEINTDNHYKGIGLHGVYDDKYNRVIITKLDYKPLIKGITYDGAKFWYNNTSVELSDTAFFANYSFTVSYSFNSNSWVSLHSYLPNYYIGENNFFYSGTPEEIWTHNTSLQLFNSYYGTIYPYIIEYPYSFQYNDEILQNVKDYSRVFQYDDYRELIETDSYYFNKCIVYSMQQSTGLLKLVPKPKNNLSLQGKYPLYNTDSKTILVTKSNSFYNFNTFWDMIKDTKKPVFTKSLNSVSEYKTLNQPNHDYSKRSYNKAPIRAKDLRIRLILDDRDDIKIISQFTIAPTQQSYK